MTTWRSCTLPLVLMAAALPAVDSEGFRDLRVGYQGASHQMRMRQYDGTDTLSSTNNWDTAHRLRADFLQGYEEPGEWGWAIGASGVADNRTNRIGTQRITYKANAAALQAGVWMRVCPRANLELVPYAGVGSATLFAASANNTATYSEYGFNVNLVIQLKGPWLIGASGGVMHGQSSHVISPASPVRVSIDNVNGTAGVFAGVRF